MNRFIDFTDYRDFIKLYFNERKARQPSYSYRQFATELGMDASQLRRVVLKQQHILPKSMPILKELLKLNYRASKWFDLMYSATLSSSNEEREKLLTFAVSLRNIEKRQLQQSELKVLYNWWTPVIRSLLEVSGGICDEQYLARMISPEVSISEVRDSLQTLLTTNQIKRRASGRCELTDPHIVASKESIKDFDVVRKYQQGILRLAAEQFSSIPVSKRHVSTLVFSVDKECFDDLQKMFLEFKISLQKRIEKVKFPDRVLQLAFALFPVAEREV